MESVCSGFVPANESCSAETAQTMVRTLVPLRLKSGTAASYLLPLPWLSLCPMLCVSVTDRTRLQSEQAEKEHRKRKIFFSWISSWPGSVYDRTNCSAIREGENGNSLNCHQNVKSECLCWRTCFADSFQTCGLWFLFGFFVVGVFLGVFFEFLVGFFGGVGGCPPAILTHPPVHYWANSLSSMTWTVSVPHYTG